jgi:hypothetical protein
MSLRLESDPPENAEFVFLSYRWGGEQKLVLSQISKHDLLRGIPLGSLPATLQDAAKVTRGLDIRYLWVDSLCIFQDSQTDLTNEIAKMESYIQQATLVLQPSLVTRIHDSFLNPCPREPDRGSSQYISDPKQTRYLKVEVVTRDGQPYPIILDRDTSWYYPSAEPINSRGWTLQERLLCSRVLIFPSVGGMIWQCETYEKIHGQIQYGFLSERDRGRAFSSRWSSSRNQPALSAKEINDAWLSLVDDYNKRDLTNPQDKLLAVSGLAKRFADNHGDILGKYCAGAWYNFLHVSLHWHTDWSGQPTPECPPLIKRAPSWSWANADRSMFWMKWGPIPHPHFRIDIIACEVDLVSPDFPLGGVTGARLQLEGVPIEVSYNLDGGVYELGHGDSANDSVLETRIGFAHLDFTETHFEPGTGIVLLPVSTADAILLRKLGEDETYVRIGNCSLIDFSRLFNEWRSRWARKSITIE